MPRDVFTDTVVRHVAHHFVLGQVAVTGVHYVQVSEWAVRHSPAIFLSRRLADAFVRGVIGVSVNDYAVEYVDAVARCVSVDDDFQLFSRYRVDFYAGRVDFDCARRVPVAIVNFIIAIQVSIVEGFPGAERGFGYVEDHGDVDHLVNHTSDLFYPYVDDDFFVRPAHSPQHVPISLGRSLEAAGVCLAVFTELFPWAVPCVVN